MCQEHDVTNWRRQFSDCHFNLLTPSQRSTVYKVICTKSSALKVTCTKRTSSSCSISLSTHQCFCDQQVCWSDQWFFCVFIRKLARWSEPSKVFQNKIVLHDFCCFLFDLISVALTSVNSIQFFSKILL